MVDDEPTLWNSIPEDKRLRVMTACKAMCSSVKDFTTYEEMDYCTGCSENDRSHGGSCCAFGLYGHMGIAVIKALEKL